MTRNSARKRHASRKAGALFWVSILLFGSAFLRIGFQAGPVIARESAEVMSAQDRTSARMPASQKAAANELGPLLQALQQREQTLSVREQQIEDRMKALEIADLAIERKLAALHEAEETLSDTLALAQGASEGDLSKLTDVYQKMKPKDSAALFETMDPGFAAGFLARMRSDSAAGIMAELSPEAAYSISVILAGRNAAVPTE